MSPLRTGQKKTNTCDTSHARQYQDEKKPREAATKLKGTSHALTTTTTLRWRKPHHYQRPGYQYTAAGPAKTTGRQLHRHRDAADRIKVRPAGDRYLHPNTGYLKRLIVMATDELIEGPRTTTWCRTYIRKVAPLKVRVASWVVDYGEDPDSWEDWFVMLLRALPAAFVTSLCVGFSPFIGLPFPCLLLSSFLAISPFFHQLKSPTGMFLPN
jgi:hypothetical protein